ncbi:MAG: group 1 truncated hemoglobin [Gammaproteobacteria bacterium]|nr:group 1 truncated hemoglobin [Gammaproteobacteria bacterium]
MKQSLFEAVGGFPTLRKVHKIFYDKIYAHPWIGQFFIGHDQVAIENRQTYFMAIKMGGPDQYMGKEPLMAHRQMYITDDLFDLRTELLRESLAEAGVPDALAERWIRIDGAFRRQIVKDSIEDFYRNTFAYEQRVIVPKPDANN